MNLKFGSKNAFFKLKLKNIWFVGQIKKFLPENYFFEKFRSSATFFIFIICAQNGYLWSYEPLKPHVKSSFFTRITFENATCEYTELTVIIYYLYKGGIIKQKKKTEKSCFKSAQIFFRDALISNQRFEMGAQCIGLLVAEISRFRVRKCVFIILKSFDAWIGSKAFLRILYGFIFDIEA